METLTEAERADLFALLSRIGSGATATTLQVQPLSLARALAGLTIRRGTALLIRTNLAKLAACAA